MKTINNGRIGAESPEQFRQEVSAEKTITSPLPDEIMSEAEVANYLKQKPRTIRDWRARRGLPHFKPTLRATLYRRSDIDAWLNKYSV